MFDINDEEENDVEILSLSCDTLNDKMSFVPLIEDVSVFSHRCNEFIYYGEIKIHRKLHKAFDLLQINDFNGLTFKSLANRRNKIIKHLKSYSPNERMHVLQKVDEAYSIIYNYLIEENHQEVPFNSSASESNIRFQYGLQSCISNLTKPDSQFPGFDAGFDIAFGTTFESEDKVPSIFVDNMSDDISIYSIISGVDGSCAKHFVSKNLAPCLQEKYKSVQKDCNTEDILSKAIEDTLVELDKCLGTGIHDNATFKSWSGCCVEIVALSKTSENLYQLTVANVGDGSVILVTKEGYKFLTTLHSMKNENEIKRIESLGGINVIINGESFLNGTTQTTQILGGYGDKKRKKCQIPFCKCNTIQIDLCQDLGLIMLNREVLRLLPVEDVVEIFKSEITDPELSLSESHTLSEVFEELINVDEMDSNFNVNLNVQENNAVMEESKAKSIARKVVNAGILSRGYDCNQGLVIFVFN